MAIYLSRTYGCRLDQQQIPSKFARSLRRADDYIRMAVIAAHGVAADLLDDEDFRNSCALYLSSFAGPMDINFSVLDSVVSQDPLSPTMFSHSVGNSAAGYIATTLGMRRGAFSFTDFVFPFFQALEQAISALNHGHEERIILLQVESYSTILADFCDGKQTAWQPGVCCWLLEKEPRHGCFELTDIAVNLDNSEPEKRLSVQEQCCINSEEILYDDPLSALLALTEAVQEKFPQLAYQVSAPHGKVHLHLQRELDA